MVINPLFPYATFTNNTIYYEDKKGLDASSRAYKKAEKIGGEARKVKDGHWTVVEAKTKQSTNEDGSINTEVSTVEHNFKDNIFDKIGNGISNFFNSLEKGRTKLMGKGENYGVGEDWVKGGKMGVKGSLEFGKYNIEGKFELFASDEYSGGAAGELSFSVSGSAKTGSKEGFFSFSEKPNFFKYEIKQSGEFFIEGTTKPINKKAIEGGIYTKNATSVEIETGISIKNASAYHTLEIDLNSGKMYNTGTIGFGNKNHNGIKVTPIKEKYTVGVSTGEGRLSN